VTPSRVPPCTAIWRFERFLAFLPFRKISKLRRINGPTGFEPLQVRRNFHPHENGLRPGSLAESSPSLILNRPRADPEDLRSVAAPVDSLQPEALLFDMQQGVARGT
jgi:hypothetical protein